MAGETMKLSWRLYIFLGIVSSLPAATLAFWPWPGAPYACAVAALATSLLAGRSMLNGMGRPICRMSAQLKSFRGADSRLDAPLRKEGWPETAELMGALNRLMLELGAYRAFHLNQVVEERAKAQALIETISDAVLLVDDRGRLIHSNKLALKILKVPSDTQDIVLPGSVGEEAFLPVLGGILASPESYVKAEVSVVCSDQEHGPPAGRDFRVMSSQFLLAAFKRPGRVIVIRDVTMEKEIESARETFFHMITHDMRAPLASIQGYAELMGKQVAPTERTEKYLHAIKNSSKRLNGMIEDILNTIKLERGGMTLMREEVNVAALCARVFELYEPLASRRNIAFPAPRPAEGIALLGDTRLLERVICNLVGNSLKFTPHGGTVTLSCGLEGENVVFAVADDGPGIPENKQKEIFGKYSQLEEHKYMGFGLGLAMCKMAVELHGGRIWVDSREGEGSKFSFTLPAGGNNG